MIHVDTLKEFNTYLPNAEEMRGKQKSFEFKAKGDGKDSGFKAKGTATFVSTYNEGMKKWVWVYQGAVQI